MLCYQYSRDATDIIHDTFDWLRINRRAIGVALLPLLGVSVLGALFLGLDLRAYADMTDVEYCLRMLRPYALYFESYTHGPALALYITLTFVATAVTVPLLRRYFYQCLSLKRVTLGTLGKMMLSDWHATLVCAVIMSLMCAGFLLIHPVIMIVALWLLVSVLPCIIMEQPVSVMVRRLGKMATNVLLAALFFCIIQALPAFATTLLLIAANYLSNLLPASTADPQTWIYAISAVLNVLACLAYALAVTTFLVNLVIIHGSLYYNPVAR